MIRSFKNLWGRGDAALRIYVVGVMQLKAHARSARAPNLLHNPHIIHTCMYNVHIYVHCTYMYVLCVDYAADLVHVQTVHVL